MADQLTDQERQQIQRLFSSPLDLPKEFKNYLVDYLAINAAAVPYSQLGGVGAIPKTIARIVAPVTAPSSTAEQTLYTAPLKPKQVGTNGRLVVLTLIGGTTVPGSSLTVRFKLGGTTVYTRDAGELSDYAAMGIDLLARDSFSSQLVIGKWLGGDDAYGQTTIDLSVAQNLTVTSEWDSTLSAATGVFLTAYVENLPQV
jgi:hypothetical protein